MKRTVIVVVATAAGLAGVLAFHTSPSSVSLSPVKGTEGSPSGPASPARGTPSGPARTAVGPQVNFSYGVLSVSVTVRGRSLVRVGIARLSDDGTVRSQSIDQQSIPVLEHEALEAQSADIQGVSGASYTSVGFRTSLQDALHALGLH
jgi:uncharacterized protein with FMN-binding domain